MEEVSSAERSSDYAYENHVQVTDCSILILLDSFISLLTYLLSLHTIHSRFLRKLTLDT